MEDFIKTIGPQTLWGIFIAIVTLIYAAVNLWLSSKFARKNEFEEVKTDVTAIKSKVTDMAQELDKLPNSDDLHKLNLEVESLRGDLKGLQNQLRPVEHLLKLLLEKELKE